MRLLEFNKDEGGANPRRPESHPQPQKAASPPRNVQPLPTPAAHTARRKTTRAARRGFAVKGNTLLKPASAPPIDLEQLQQRITALEKRLGQISGQASGQQLEQLQKRLQRLETSLQYELWQAKQREYTMMEMLSKPTLKTRIRQRLVRFIHSDLPRLGHLLQRELHRWWQDSQPGWWPELARVWKESLDRARQ